MASNVKSTDRPSFGQRFVFKCKDMVRKFIVALKRRPHYIAFAAFIIGFLIYSFNMSSVSDTTIFLSGKNMGLASFATMLFGMLSLLCFMNAFPYRKKVNKVMLCVMIAMVLLIIFCDVFYLNSIATIVSDPEANIEITATKNFFIVEADYYLRIHIGFLVAGLALTALLPVYSKLIRKINTNVDVEGNGEMAAIDLASD